MARILVVEDSPDERQVLTELLSGAGHDVQPASHGREALKFLDQGPVHLAIMDILMPEMDGIETILAMRRHFPLVKIIAVSGGGIFGPEHCLRLARNLGARYVLEKPFTGEEILAAVSGALGGAQSGFGSAAAGTPSEP